MATTLLVSDSYDPRSHLYDEDPESQASYQAERHDRWFLACAAGGMIGLLIRRSHHPVAWTSLMALVVTSVVAAFYLQRRGWFLPNPRSTTAWPGIGPR
jgi:hypothetical protein